MEQVAEVVLESGMRASLTRSTMDKGEMIPASMKAPAKTCIQGTEELYRHYNGKGDGRLAIWFGLRQIISCSDELIRMTGLPENAPVFRLGSNSGTGERWGCQG